MPILHMQTEAVRATGQQINQTSESLRQQAQQLRGRAQQLANEWQGPSASMFEQEMQALLQRAQQSAEAGGALNQKVQKEVDEWERVAADLGLGGSMSLGWGIGGLAGIAGAVASGAKGALGANGSTNNYDLAVGMNDYYLEQFQNLSGADGTFEVVNDFPPFPDYLYQDDQGPLCTFYALLRHLHMQGITFSEEEVNDFLKNAIDKHGHSSGGISAKFIKDFLKEKGISYDYEDFNRGLLSGNPFKADRKDAAQFLVEQIKNGNPVCLSYIAPSPSGIHAANVVGIKFDNQGKPAYVLIDTNYSMFDKPQVQAVSFETFLDKWLNAESGFDIFGDAYVIKK